MYTNLFLKRVSPNKKRHAPFAINRTHKKELSSWLAAINSTVNASDSGLLKEVIALFAAHQPDATDLSLKIRKYRHV